MQPIAPPVDGQDWLTSEPIPWDALDGRAVIIVFWSAGCDASLIRVRQVEAIVDSTDLPITAIAVHTPRFPFEENLDVITSTVAQHGFAIPVVHDPEYLTWNRYNPDGWPATVVIDSRGRVLGTQAGTNDIDVIMNTVVLGLPETTDSGSDPAELPNANPLPLPVGDLAFPTSVTARANGELVVADFGHDRLLLFELSDDLRHGSAIAEICGFDHPYGVVADDADGLYVTEPSLGSVSFLDLAEKRRQLLTSELVNPTSLCLDVDGSVVVTDTGAETIWRIINNGDGGEDSVTAGRIGGSGITGAFDGPAGTSELAQPTGIARAEVGLVFCDAASSNIRLLTDTSKVATITGNGFFDWGLVDGPAHMAKLQRPSDLVVMDDGSIVIVDTGNNRLRRLAKRRIRTLGLSGLNRPAGICKLESGHLVVADTGNGRLIVVEPTLASAWPLSLHGVLPTPDDVPTPALPSETPYPSQASQAETGTAESV